MIPSAFIAGLSNCVQGVAISESLRIGAYEWELSDVTISILQDKDTLKFYSAKLPPNMQLVSKRESNCLDTFISKGSEILHAERVILTWKC